MRRAKQHAASLALAAGLLLPSLGVSHAKDTAGNTLRMEILKRIHFLASTCKLDRLACNRTHGKRRTTAAITVHTGEDHTGYTNLVTKLFRDIDGVLAGKRINNQQCFMRIDSISNRCHLSHQCLINMKSARRIKHYNIKTLNTGLPLVG